MRIDRGFASGAVVGHATKHERGCPLLRARHKAGRCLVRGTQTRHRRFLVVASLRGYMPTRTTMSPTGIDGGNHAKITTYHCTICVISNSLGHNLSVATVVGGLDPMNMEQLISLFSHITSWREVT